MHGAALAWRSWPSCPRRSPGSPASRPPRSSRLSAGDRWPDLQALVALRWRLLLLGERASQSSAPRPEVDRDEVLALLRTGWPAPLRELAGTVLENRARSLRDHDPALGDRAAATAVAWLGPQHAEALYRRSETLASLGEQDASHRFLQRALEAVRGSWFAAEHPEILSHLETAVDQPGWKPEQATEEGGPVLERLDAASAIQSLHALHDILRKQAAAYQAAKHRLERSGGSWAAFTAGFEERLRARGELSRGALFDLLVEYLSVLEDGHLQLSAPDPEAPRAGWERPATPWQQMWFSDWITERVGHRHLLIAAGSQAQRYLGWEVVGLEEVTPGEGLPVGRAALYPSLSQEPGAAARRRYRLGWAAPHGQQPARVSVELVPPSGTVVRVAVAFDRSPAVGTPRPGSGQAHSAVTLDLPEEQDRPAVLRIRSFNEKHAAALLETAAPLRDRDRIVVDLRGNRGGSARLVTAWLEEFSGRPLGEAIADGRMPIESSGATAGWVCHLEGLPHFPDQPACGAASTVPRLVVLVDRDTASAAEAFTAFAAQLPYTRVVGEHTRGAVAYSSARAHALPGTGFQVRVSHQTGFVSPRNGPEGQGVVPDLWIDDADPLSLAEQLFEDPAEQAQVVR